MAVGIMAIANNLAFQPQQAAYTTTSTTEVFTGTGVILIPKTSGTVRIGLDADISNNTIGDGVTLNVNYATGTALTAAGTAVAGTAILGTAITKTAVAQNLAFQGQEAAYTTTSLTLVFTGTGVILTPKISGNVKIGLDAIVSDNTAATSVNLNVNYEAGTALLAAGTAVAGTAALATAVAYESVLAGAVNHAHIEYEVTGLTVGTSYIFEPVFDASAASTASFTQIDMWAEEINDLVPAQGNTAHVEYQLTGLTLNTSYTFQPVFMAVTGGTASFTQTDMWVEEI